MTLRFDPVEHRYFVGDVEYPSVSSIIAPLVDYSMVPEARLEFARDRGTAVHLACHLDDIGELDEDSVDQEHVLPRLTAWRKFKADFKPKIVFSEMAMFRHDDVYRFAGTPDRAMEIGRLKVVGDIKNVAEMSPVTGVQLSGYELLLAGAVGFRAKDRWGIQLRGNGTYRRVIYPVETPTFASLHTLKNWSIKHG